MKNECLKMEVNLHTHTARCKHAKGMPDDYCKAALEQNLKVLGFSDHAPFPDNRFSGSRMDFQDLSDYCRDVETAKEKYSDLKIYSGLEIEYCSDIGHAYYREELLGERKLDYLIGAVHFVKMPDQTIHPFYSKFQESDDVILEFIRHTLLTMENLPLLYLAHPDCMGHIAGTITPEMKSGFRDIVEAAVDLDIPLEINTNGFRKGLFDTPEGKRLRYPLDAFWEIAAEYNVSVVIGSDAHTPGQLTDFYASSLAYANRFGLRVCNHEIIQRLNADIRERDV